MFRTLIGEDIPLNAGCLEPLDIKVPEGSMLSPTFPAAVVAGNVETSMCVTNALYGALGVMAAGPTTMSNFTFGNARHQYYETVAGGWGAGGRYDSHGALQGGFAGTSVARRRRGASGNSFFGTYDGLYVGQCPPCASVRFAGWRRRAGGARLGSASRWPS